MQPGVIKGYINPGKGRRSGASKGYIVSVEASLEDNCLFGKMLFIKALSATKGKPSPSWIRPFATRKKVTLNDLTRQALHEFLQHHGADASPALG